MSQLLQTPPQAARTRPLSVYTPLTAYMDSAVLPANLPPSLTDTSSSPPFSSPRTGMSSVPNMHAMTPLKAGTWKFSALHNLSSSPPDVSVVTPAPPKSQSSLSLQPPYEPNRLESSHFAAAISRRKSAPAATQTTPKPTALKRSQDDALLAKPLSKLLPSSFSETVGSEYGLRSSKCRFVIDDAGHVSLRKTEKSPRQEKKRSALSAKEISSILEADSDSDSESEFGTDAIAGNDAISAFARTLARSRVGQLENKNQRARSSSNSQDDYSTAFPYGEREPRTPTSSGSLVDGCVRISRLLQGSLATPPGAVFGFDAMNVYATGMTPYLPRS